MMALMTLSPRARLALAAVMAPGLAVVYVPLLVVLISSFNTDRTFSWPPNGLTLDWWNRAWHNAGARGALGTSVRAGLGATAVALVLGTLIAFAVAALPLLRPQHGVDPRRAADRAARHRHRHRAVQRDHDDAAAARASTSACSPSSSGHSTFCIVVVYNNVLARLRRTGSSLEEASMDLGAGVWQTFRHVTFPAVRSALLAGGLLAFALSFDEIIVTTFTAGASVQTLPMWIFSNLARPNQAPVVNVVAAVSSWSRSLPVWLAQRVSADAAGGRL